MAFKETRVQTPLGMRLSYFYPITAEPVNAHPTYGAGIDLGAAVKGYLTLNVASASIPGDDVDQVDIEVFAGGQLDAETTLNDLEVNSTLYGHTFSADAGEESKADDMAIDGGYAFIEPIFTKAKGTFYRATCLYKVTPLASSEKQEADTRKKGEFNPKLNVVSYRVKEDNTRAWRKRKDFDTEAAAKTFIESVFNPSA